MKKLYKIIFFNVIILLFFNKMTNAQEKVRFENDFFDATGKVGFYLPEPFDPLKGTSTHYKSIFHLNLNNITDAPYWSLRIRVQDVHTGLHAADEYIHTTIMNATLYPEIHFQLDSILPKNGINVPFLPNQYVEVNLIGNLSYHGVTKKINIPVTLRYKSFSENNKKENAALEVYTDFTINLADYGINVPFSLSKRLGSFIHLFVQISTPSIS